MSEFLTKSAHFGLITFYALKFAIVLLGFLILFAPVFVYRWILGLLHRLLYPRNAGLVPALSATYVDSDGALRSDFNLIAILKFDGHIELESFVQRISKTIVYARDERGRLLHPELQQHIEIWGGYPFWVSGSPSHTDGFTDFDVRTHILSYEQLVEATWPFFTQASTKEERDEEFCRNFATRYVQQALRPGRSPWEMVVLQNVVRSDAKFGTDTVIVFKFHHSLADGYSMFSTVMKCADSPIPRYEPPLPSRMEQILAQMAYPILAPIDIARLRTAKFPKTPWDKSSVEEDRLFAKTRQLPMKNLKEISALYKIPFTAVLLGMLGHAIRSFILKHRRVHQKPLPDFILCGISLPTPNHPEGLTNDWYFTYIKVPLRGNSQMDLIRAVESQFPEIKRSTLHVTRQILHKLIFSLPAVWKWKTKLYSLFYGGGRKPWPTLLSSMPGPKETVVVDGRRMLEMSYIYNRAHGNPCLMTMLSYETRFQLWFSVDEAITFGQGVDKLVAVVNEHFEKLDVTAVNNPLEG